MYFIYYVTSQNHSIEVPYIFMGESCSHHATILEGLAAIGFLIVKRKKLHQKYEFYKSVQPLKNWAGTAIEKLSWLGKH